MPRGLTRHGSTGFTIAFTLEYALRLWGSPQPGRYARSFFGLVDLLATLPAYLTVVHAGASMLLVMRLVWVLRLFRLFKLLAYVQEADAQYCRFCGTRLADPGVT